MMKTFEEYLIEAEKRIAEIVLNGDYEEAYQVYAETKLEGE